MMGVGSVWHWLILLLIVLLIFGTKKLKGAGRDLGESISAFRKGLKDGAQDEEKPAAQEAPQALEAKKTESAKEKAEDAKVAK